MRFGTSLAFILTSLGCASPSPPDSHAELDYIDGSWLSDGVPDPAFGDPIASGATAVLRLQNDIGPFTLSSSDESVLTTTWIPLDGTNSIEVQAVAPGAARLLFTGPQGEIDNPELRVREVAELRWSQPSVVGRMLVMVGSEVAVSLDQRDASGTALVGYGAVRYGAAGGIELATVSELAEPLLRGGSRATWPEHATVRGAALGPAVLNARAGDAALSLEIEVVDASAVTRITLVHDDGLLGEGMVAMAFTADDEEIFDPQCEWSVEPPGVRIDANGNPYSQIDSDEERYATVTCRIGEASATLDVSYR